MINNPIVREDLDRICSLDLEWEKLKSAKVLITGATGIIGSYLVYTLYHLNTVYPQLNLQLIVHCGSGKHLDKLQGCQKLHLFKGDIRHFYVPHDMKLTHIFHTASLASSQHYDAKPYDVLATNINSTQNLLFHSLCNRTNFMYFSSGEVCGEIDAEAINESDTGHLDPTRPRSCYGESKRACEALCACFTKQYSIPTYIVRPDHTYGPSIDIINDKRVYSEFVGNLVRGENLEIKGQPDAARTFCYISDAIEGYLRVLLLGVPGEAYHVSNNACRIKISDLAEKLVQLYPEKGLKVNYTFAGRGFTENPHHNRPALSTAKLEALGYVPKINLEEGFKRTIASFEV